MVAQRPDDDRWGEKARRNSKKERKKIQQQERKHDGKQGKILKSAVEKKKK